MYKKEIREFLERKQYPEFNPKGVLFDMDGVLFDSMEAHAHSWVKVMTEKGFPFTEMEVYMNEGQTGAITINKAFMEYRGREATEEEKNHIYALKSRYFDEYNVLKPIKGTFSLLNKIKSAGLQVVVVTGSGQKSLFDNLDKFFPSIFDPDKIITAYDVKYGKPYPEPYLKGLAKTGLNPWEVIAVDNAPLGVKSASSAELFTIGVNTGPLPVEVLAENGANVVLDGMVDLDEKWNCFSKQIYR
ncbi:HAD-IA family hydrolase [Paludibacteraceae bacterium OttesenSCG-928-F17]|nr:HAD-IA family hydrolase [Paludibacteraceae bacterium OttesenSCG-928-F17]